MNVDFPLRHDATGRTAAVDQEEHIRDMIEQVLFTAPGERVNRPDFGSGLLQLVFAPNSDELASATRLLVQGSLQRWLGELIQVDDVEVQNVDSVLRVKVTYTILRSQERRAAEFSRGV
jgi:phage baseplate assembly protein W